MDRNVDRNSRYAMIGRLYCDDDSIGMDDDSKGFGWIDFWLSKSWYVVVVPRFLADSVLLRAKL